MTPETELLLFLASRAELVRKVIVPALDQASGSLRPLPRFHHRLPGSARKLPIEVVERVNAFAVGPHLPASPRLDLEPREARRRQEHRTPPPVSAPSTAWKPSPPISSTASAGYLDLAATHPSASRSSPPPGHRPDRRRCLEEVAKAYGL